jgi:hypothetical protein
MKYFSVGEASTELPKKREAEQTWLPDRCHMGTHMASRTEYIGPQSIADLRPGDMLWDSQLRRFGARCRPRATTYFIKARIDGRQRWFTLGRHGPLTEAEARSKARQMLADIDSGRDPTRERETPTHCRGCSRKRKLSSLLAGELSKPIVLPNDLANGAWRQAVLLRPLSLAEHQEFDVQWIVQRKFERMGLLAERLGVNITGPDDWGAVALRLAEELVEGLKVVTAHEAWLTRRGNPGGHRTENKHLPELVRMVESRRSGEKIVPACKRICSEHKRKGIAHGTLKRAYYRARKERAKWEAGMRAWDATVEAAKEILRNKLR